MYVYKFKPTGILNKEIYKTDIWIPSNDVGIIGYCLYNDKDYEICYVLPYIKENVLGICEISTGNEVAAEIDYTTFDRIKTYFSPSSLLVMHNHPDNRALFPSPQDRKMNRSCIMYCRDILNIKLKDKLIFIPNGQYISFVRDEE